MADDHRFTFDTGIDPEEIARVRGMIGQPLRIAPYNNESTRDAIRHYAHGLGDDNPLWCDEAYAAASHYGGIVAPPTWFYSVFSPGVTPGFDGLQAFFGTGEWTINRYALRNEQIKAETKLIDVTEKTGGRAKRMVVQTGQTTYHNDSGELLASYVSQSIRTPRATQEGGIKYEPRAAHIYTLEELEEIGSRTLAQTRRGAEPLYFEDVAVGDTVPTRIKGPLNQTALITYYAGNLANGYQASEMQWKTRWLAQNHPEKVPNNRSIGWLIETTWPGMGHVDPKVAQSIGMPNAYDNGWNRLGWIGQVVTDWIGDKGVVKTLSMRARLPNLLGDTLWCKGKVSDKRIEDGRGIVEVELEAVNQIGQISCTGKGTAELPLKVP
jgi:acyl dehydratase